MGRRHRTAAPGHSTRRHGDSGEPRADAARTRRTQPARPIDEPRGYRIYDDLLGHMPIGARPVLDASALDAPVARPIRRDPPLGWCLVVVTDAATRAPVEWRVTPATPAPRRRRRFCDEVRRLLRKRGIHAR
jgi:hypothetical protein